MIVNDKETTLGGLQRNDTYIYVHIQITAYLIQLAQLSVQEQQNLQ